MAKEKKPKPLSVEFLKSLENEDSIHDDHGSFIIGDRDQSPQDFETEEKEETEK